MKERITVSGFVATEPEQTVGNETLTISTFRIGTTERVRDRATGAWRDGHTNWFTVKAFRELARNVMACVHKGEPVIVTGHLKVKKWRRDDGTNTTFVELEADSIGHDLAWGSTRFARTRFARQRPDDASAEVDEGVGEGVDETGSEQLDPETGELTGAGAEPRDDQDADPWAVDGPPASGDAEVPEAA